jgi:hypothetical protein
MTTIELDSSIARKLDQGMRTGDATEIPFPVVYVWALNGQASYRSQSGALYYGGWACKSEDLQASAEAQELALPKDWQPVTISSRDGGEFEAYTARYVIIAPIGKRLSWLHDAKRSANYIEGARRHVQILAFMAETAGEIDSRQFIPWGPVVLTAKGYQARNVLDSLTRWEKATASMRRKIAPQVPAWCFYLSLGTYGKERHVSNVGKPGAQSPITPISEHIPTKLTEETMHKLFVGEDIANRMVELQDQASEWLKAWSAGSLEEIYEDQENGFDTHEELAY